MTTLPEPVIYWTKATKIKYLNHSKLYEALKQLRLSGLASGLDLQLQETTGNNLAHEEFLELLVQDELNLCEQRTIQ